MNRLSENKSGLPTKNLSRLEDEFFNKQSVFPWESTVLLFLITFSFIHMRLTLTKKELVVFFNFTSCYKDDAVLLNNSKFGDYDDRIHPIEL